MKSVNSILSQFTKTVRQLDSLAAANVKKADLLRKQRGALEVQEADLHSEAQAASSASARIQNLLKGDE